MIGHCCTAINYLNLNSKRYPCYNDNMAKKSIQRTKAKGHGHLLASSLLLIGVTAVGNMTTTREQPALLKDQENGFPQIIFCPPDSECT
jgi:hypothetical protein